MNNIIITYGLLEEQRTLLESALSEEYDISTLDCITDLIVTDAVCTVINAEKLSEAGMRTLLAYYMDVGDRLDEIVVWLGNVDLPKLPSFVQFENYLQLLLNCEQTIKQAQSRYDTMQQYTDVYSYLPKHAIAECLEADYFSALKQWLPNYPLKEAMKLWTSVLELENGPELLASISELCRWLKKENIVFRMSHNVRWQIFVLLFFMMEDGISYTSEYEFDFCFCKEDYHRITVWLKNHWYFRNSDDRVNIYPVDGLESGIASIDVQIMGMRPGEVILVGGRPAMGKTSFARGVARHVGKANRVLYMDLEESGISEMEGVTVLSGSTFSLENILTAATEAKPDLLIVDRLQRITEIIDGGSLQLTMRKLKKLAKALRFPVLITTDLSRDIEERPCPVPCEKDIPAYSVISQFVDTVLLLYRPAYYDPELDRSLARMYVPKAKRVSHPYRTVHLRWDDENHRFTD